MYIQFSLLCGHHHLSVNRKETRERDGVGWGYMGRAQIYRTHYNPDTLWMNESAYIY